MGTISKLATVISTYEPCNSERRFVQNASQRSAITWQIHHH